MATFYPINSPLINYFFYPQPVNGVNVPLAGGKLFFYEDEDHTMELPTYSDVSNPAAPVINTDPITLGAAGECDLFYLEDRLYYIVITDSTGDQGNPIKTIEHYNPLGSAGVGGIDVTNYIPNGQFRLHNITPAVGAVAAGNITQAITQIAPGNWTFERPVSTSSVDVITFTQYTTWAANPTSNPLFSLTASCTTFDAADSIKDICVSFPDVNTFASDTQNFTISFEGQDLLGGSIPINVFLIKNFGTGGSTETETLLTTFNLGATMSGYVYSFAFGDNSGKIIGTLGDDYVKIAFRRPVDELSSISVTNFSMQEGELSVVIYPETTQQQDVSAAMGGAFPIPDPYGMDNGLSPIWNGYAWEFDNSVVGTLAVSFSPSKGANYLPCDGARYERLGYSSTGIPYARLWNELYDQNLLSPIYGTGIDFVTMFLVPVNNGRITLSTNQAGVYAAVTDGSVSTGFTYNHVTTGTASINIEAFGTPANNSLIANRTVLGVLNASSGAGTSGFIVTDLRNYSGLYGSTSININSVDPTTLGGKYLLISNTTTNYYVWFKYNGSGADPAVGGATGILVNLYTSVNTEYLIDSIVSALNGFESTSIVFTAGSAVVPGSYFTFSCGAGDYYCFFTKDGVGTDPALAGKTAIEVDCLSANSAAAVGSNTIAAVNTLYFAVPDPRGLYFRFTDDGAGVDIYASTRYSRNPNYYGDQVGTQQLDGILSHGHTYTYDSYTFALNNYDYNNEQAIQSSSQTVNNSATGNASNSPGQIQNDVKNINVNVYIHL